MKNILISISKTTVFDKVSLQTAYTGAKNSSRNDLYDRVATIVSDGNLLSEFWTETCGRITDRLKDFISSSVLNDEGFTLHLELSGGYDESLTPSVENDLLLSMTAGITGLWYRITLPERSDEYLSQSLKALDGALSKLCHRKRPRRIK